MECCCSSSRKARLLLKHCSLPPALPVVQEDRKLLAGLQQAVAAKEQQGSLQPFSLPDALDALHLAVSYRLSLKQALEKSLIGVRARLKGANKASEGLVLLGARCRVAVEHLWIVRSCSSVMRPQQLQGLSLALCARQPHAPPPPPVTPQS